MTNEQTHHQETPLPVIKSSNWNIFAPENRGMLFDIIIFLINLLFMGFLTNLFTQTGRNAYAGVRVAQIAVIVFFASLFIFQPLGANFKRWKFHQRRRAGRRRKKSSDAYVFTFADNIFFAVLFNPLLYFGILVFTSMVIISLANELIIGKSISDDDSTFIVFILVGFLISVVHSLTVYRYFTSPTKEPKNKMWYDSMSGNYGDILLFVNILFFQILWNIVGQIPSQSMHTLGDYSLRAFFLIGMSLLIYFPSRIFYSAEDIKKPLAWLTMLLAISPLIIRFLST
jgi:hypothetical protein